MASDDRRSFGRQFRYFLVYVAIGAGIFAVVLTWVFAGLRFWGN